MNIERIEFNLQVLKHFVRLYDFKNRSIIEALRDFLWNFRLPGEAQKIDRMTENFAQRYCECNPEIFTAPGEKILLNVLTFRNKTNY